MKGIFDFQTVNNESGENIFTCYDIAVLPYWNMNNDKISVAFSVFNFPPLRNRQSVSTM